MQTLIDSIKAPKLASLPDSSGNLALLLGALGGRSGSSVGNIPATGKALKAVTAALSQKGVPYKWGGTAWGKALDCSGLVQGAYAKAGISIPRTSQAQWASGKKVSSANLKAGDLVFFHMGSSGPQHVGMYIGNDNFVESPHTGTAVKVEKLSTYGGYVGARRYS
jgi:cell wall-associated NlpC family hydrolase